MKPTVLDLFAGCGGLSIGLEAAGFSVKWANEKDEDAARAYESHHDAAMWCEDVSQFLNRIVNKENPYFIVRFFLTIK